MPDGNANMAPVRFTLDGKAVDALPGETIWQAAQRAGTAIPHLCYAPEPGYRPDGNCRACMVEIDGERVLAASCIRKPRAGMVVKSASERARASQKMVFEVLAADQPARDVSPDPDSKFWRWADTLGITGSRFPAAHAHAVRQENVDRSHLAMAVNLDACIQCGLCVRACREVQVNDVIGMAYRGADAKIVFDFDQAMGSSTCVACGECVQACPTGALLESALVDAQGKRAAKPDRSVDTVCPFCGVGCQTTVYVQGEGEQARVLQVDGRNGPANEQRLCVKGRFGQDYGHHPDRLKMPLVRRDDAPKRWDMEIAPGDVAKVFREATWEEALDRAAAGLKKVRDRDGPSAMAGFGSAKGSNEEAYLFQKLVRTGFGTNNVDHCTRLCHASSVAALMEGIGSGAVTAPFTAARDADCIIVIGARPTENHPVAATYLKQAAKRGATLIVMDPRAQGLSRHAKHFLQFKPGSDVSLLNAMLNVIVEEGLTDRQYIQAHVEGFEQLKAEIKAFTPEAMAPHCGIPAETIRTVARTYAKSERSIIFWGMGISQHVHGTDNARCLIALALTTGQTGRKGTGLHPLRGQNNVQGASDAGLIPMVFPDYRSVESPEIRAIFEQAWGKALDPKRGLTVVEIVNAAYAGTIKAMYVMGENPAMSDPDQRHARQGLAKLEHLVVQDIFLTETAWFADVVLPATTKLEKAGTFTNTNRQVQMARPVMNPPGEARQDWWLIQALAQRLGEDWSYLAASDVFAEMASLMPSFRNITWERLERESAVTYPCDAPDKPGNEIMFADGYPTKTKRGKIVPARLVPPNELPDAQFPYVLTTGRMLEHWHTGAMTRRAGVLDALEPEATVGMARTDLRKLGVQPGDMVKVATRRGTIVLKARSDENVPEGLLFIPFCYAEAAANVLTNPQLDPVGKIPEFKFCAARIEKLVQAEKVAAE